MDPIKVQGVTDWPQLTKVKDVQSFIGFVNFYRRFIWNFSEIAHPLHALTRKSKNWSWGTAEQQAFDALKNAVTSAPMLAFPSKSGLFQLECNASNFATGAVLSQQQEDGLFHPIGFMSKSFSDTERNYQIHDKEMLAIMHTLEEWRHFLEGSDQMFEIHTDHKNLSYFQEAHKLNRCRRDKNSVSSPPLEPCFDIPNNSPNHLLNSLLLCLEKLAKKSSNQTTHLFSCQNSL